MRSKGTPAELERRRLAVDRVHSGDTQQEVADFVDVDLRSVQRWMHAYRQEDMWGLKARPATGRKPKLSPEEEREVLQWFRRSPTEFGFPTEL